MARQLQIFAIIFSLPILVARQQAMAVNGWFDDTYRRAIDTTWDADHASGSELAYVEFLTGGHHNPDGSDLRVATDEGRQVAAKVLRIGPGDQVSLIFSLTKGVKKYHVYFGNPTPPANKPGFDNVKVESGLLLEMHDWPGGPVENAAQVETAWDKAGPLVGRAMIDSPFLGINPFGPQRRSISKITGSLFAPLDGDYVFSLFVEDRGSLYFDGKNLLFARRGPADVSQQAKIHLKRGRHDFLFYHVNTGSEGRFTVAWQRPDARGWEAIPRGSFGIFARGNAGPLEQLHKTLVADFTAQYAGECFYVDGYSHRHKFAVHEPKNAARANYEWDFGDGQTASTSEVEHVYLTDGVYPVKLTLRLGPSNDAITSKIAVSRDWPRVDRPTEDDPIVQSKIVAKYEVSAMPPEWLPRATWLHEHAGQTSAMLAAAGPLASAPKHPNGAQAFDALLAASNAAVAKGQTPGALKLWEQVPASSDLQPRAAEAYGRLLLWQTADFPAALKVLEPYGSGDNPAIRRLYADALALNQKAEAARKILESLPVEDSARQAAKSGALARTIEYYIAERDWETGEAQWDLWQERYPADFLEGYSIVLKTRLMELKGVPQSAAKVAEAFATAAPGSSYAPQLLFRAAKLLESSDPARSQGLIRLLKERYPEDPLSQ